MSAWRPGAPLEFETARFRVRPLGVDDVNDDYVGWWNDPEIRYGLGTVAADWDRARAARFVQQFNHRTNYHVGIFPKQAVLAIGYISVFLEPGDRARSETVVGDKHYWGKGAVLEVRRELLRVLFEDGGAFRVYGQVHSRNFPAIANYKKLGFTCEGILREHVCTADGERHDALIFGLLAREWDARRGARGEDG